MGMAALKLDAHEWTDYFRAIVANNDGALATVALQPQQSGGADDRRRLPLRAIGYDSEEDVVEVALGGEAAHCPAIRYFVAAPRAVTVAESNFTKRILVADASGVQTLILVFARGR
jgi:hypothetical protein